MDLQPRILRLKDAPAYLGMDKNKFNELVRPFVTEIRYGSMSVGFDRLDLDAWADEYKGRNGRPGQKGGNNPWREKRKCQVSSNGGASGTSTRDFEAREFEKALEAVKSRGSGEILSSSPGADPAGRSLRCQAEEDVQAGRNPVSQGVNQEHVGRGRTTTKMYLDPYVGNLPLEAVHMGSLQQFIRERKFQRGKEEERGIRDVRKCTINCALQTVRHILNLAASEWLDERGQTWLAHAPKIKLLSENDKKEPYPLSPKEQLRLFNELPEYLAKMALFKVNTGCRDQEVCNLRWEWEIEVPELKTSVFIIPADRVKNRQDRLVVLNRVAKSIIEKCVVSILSMSLPTKESQSIGCTAEHGDRPEKRLGFLMCVFMI